MDNNQCLTKQIIKWLMCLALIVIMIGIVGCYALIDEPTEIERNDEFLFYTIDPTTILESIDRGNIDIFKVIEGTPQVVSSPSSEPISWMQKDYFKIAQVLHQQSWQESLGAQNLYSMLFSMDCAEIERGAFSYASFLTFKVIGTGKQERRVQYSIAIDPLYHRVLTTKAEFSPNIKTKKAIDPADYLISAEEALQIAERNGGAEKRLQFGNACLIDALTPGPDGEGWQILYVNRNDKLESIFEIVVDAKTGAFKILENKH